MEVMLAFSVDPKDVVPPPPSDEDEVRSAIAQRDRRRALEALMRAYGDHVYRFCLRALGDPARAEDALQQSFADAWEALPRFAQRSSPRTWLFGIVAHRCLDSARRQRRYEARFESGALPEDRVDSAAPADELLARALARRALEECLDSLASATRVAVVLRYMEGFGYREMAEICGAKAATLQARVARALPLLRRCMGRKAVRE